ncbi:MAG: alkane 1-monooxygenase [Gemmobacter sp.]
MSESRFRRSIPLRGIAASLGHAFRSPDATDRTMRIFAAASLAPVVLILLGIWFGGLWALAALVFITGIVATLDHLSPRAAPHLPGAADLPAADRLSVAIALVHLALLPVVLWAVSGDSGLSAGARLAIFLAAGLWVGQVSNANAHELIHRRARGLYRLGVAVYVSLLFGHHASSHRLIHHRHVASDNDPNSAQRGESFYAFLPRAWIGSFVAGYEMEKGLRARLSRPSLNPYLWYVGGGVSMLVVVTWLFGFGGLIVYLALCAHAQIQLLLSDYVQHYGLSRARRPDGKLEPVGPQHSWDAPHWLSSAMMLNAPRHADHHAHPGRAYPALDLMTGAPRLPYALPVMGAIALVPQVWFRLMDPRLPPPPNARRRPAF